MMLGDLSKPVLIHVCKDRTLTITYGKNWNRPFNGVAIPVYGTDSIADAEALIRLVSSLQYTAHPDIPGEKWYKINYYRVRNGLRELVRYLEVDDLTDIKRILREAEESILCQTSPG